MSCCWDAPPLRGASQPTILEESLHCHFVATPAAAAGSRPTII